MERKTLSIVLSVISILISILAVFMASVVLEALNSLNKELINLKMELTVLKEQTKESIYEIEERLNRISKVIEKVDNLYDEIYSINKELKNLNEKLQNLSEEVQDIYLISEHIREWITKSKVNESMIREALWSCMKLNKFDLGCFSFFLYNKYKITYIEDEKNWNKSDYMITPATFLKVKGGDCEDYSLMYQRLIDFLKEKGIISIRVPIYYPGKKYILYEEGGTIWYLRDSDYKEIYIYDKFSYVVCFEDVEENGTVLSGHCFVAICKNPLEYIIKMGGTNSYFVNNCYLIEPQAYGSIYQLEGEGIYKEDNETVKIYYRLRYSQKGITNMGEVNAIISSNKICEKHNLRWICLPFQK